ncbi:MAG: Uma2 family endonuclease [Trueperaceae bacterium]
MQVELPKRSFTVDEYYKMAESGIFESERVELVEGEVVAMAPKGSSHAGCVTRLTSRLGAVIGQDALLRVQDPLRLNDRTEVEPDLAIVRFRTDYYSAAHPSAADALLVIEVADSSLAYDRHVKMPLYARFGIAEAWLVDLTQSQVLVHSEPSAQGYRGVVVSGLGRVISSVAMPQFRLAVDDIVG